MKKMLRALSLMLVLVCVLSTMACDIQGIFGSLIGGTEGGDGDGQNNDPGNNSGGNNNAGDAAGDNANGDGGQEGGEPSEPAEPVVVVVDSGKCGADVSWSLNSAGKLTISGNGKMDDYSEKAMPDYSSHLDSVTEVVIESGVTSIGKCAFYGFDKLSNVTLPKTLIFIGNYAFYNCNALEGEIVIPAGVMQIGSFAFRKSGISSVSFGSTEGWCAGEDEISSEALVSEGAVELLTKTYFKNGWERSIGGIEWVLSDTGILYIYGDGAMPNYRAQTMPWYESINSITDVVIYEGVTSIGNRAFYGATALEHITLPESITCIGLEAFQDCEALAEIGIPAAVSQIGKRAFKNSGLLTVTFECTDGWMCDGASVELPDAETAATCLKDTYRGSEWTRGDSGEIVPPEVDPAPGEDPVPGEDPAPGEDLAPGEDPAPEEDPD